MKYAAYEDKIATSVQWLKDIPKHWDVRRLKTAATYCVSNVDKVPADDETPVRLCNYTDVYYNDLITPDMGLMETTATVDEVRKFGLRVNDVVITKDSEDWRDIAVASMVARTAPNLVCGYHLAIVRPHADKIHGPFLLRLFQSSAVNQQFQIAASGVTRYGLPKSAIGEAWLPVPPIDEQQTIARFLDAKTAQIDALLAHKRQLIAKLKEKRSALIARTVTRGLPPEAAKAAGLEPHPQMKDSGVDWLGAIPTHWATPPLYARYLVELGKMLSEAKITGEHLIPYLRNVDIQWNAINYQDLPEMDISPAEYPRYTIRAGDLLVCEGGEVGRAAIVGKFDGVIGYQKALHKLRALRGDEDQRFMCLILEWAAQTGIFNAEGISTIAHLTGDQLRKYRFPKPPKNEQQAIVQYLQCETDKISHLQREVETAITRLTEYRLALITAAVTGKIDVREPA